MGERVGGHCPIFWGNYSNDENIYMKYTVDFGWPPIDNGSHNNQPNIGVHNRGKYGGEVRQAGGVWKYDTIVVTKIEQQRKKKKKYTLTLNGHRQINFHTTTNQK